MRWTGKAEADKTGSIGHRASKLRKKGEANLDAKYDGKKGSRKALYNDDDDDDQDEGTDEDEEMGDFGDFDDLENQSGEDDGDDDEDSDGEEEEEDEEESEEEEVVAPAPKVKVSRAAKAKAQDEKAMLSQLKQAASADVEKGRDVKKQLVSPANLAHN